MDIYTIIFLALAVFIFLRLRNVLGQRTGNERPPFDRAARNTLQGAPDNNVVPMPGKVIDQAPLAPSSDVAPPPPLKPLSSYRVANSYRSFIMDEQKVKAMRERYLAFTGPVTAPGTYR